MDVSTIRKRNIELLVEQFGGPTEFGRMIERDQAQVSQWTSDTKPKPIGGRLARHIESKLGKPNGWMDAPQWDAAPLSQSHAVRLDVEMISDVARVLQEQFKELGLVYNLAEDPELFAWMYERRAAMVDIRTPDNMVRLGMKIQDRVKGTGEDERSTQVPSKGTPAGKDGHRRAKG